MDCIMSPDSFISAPFSFSRSDNLSFPWTFWQKRTSVLNLLGRHYLQASNTLKRAWNLAPSLAPFLQSKGSFEVISMGPTCNWEGPLIQEVTSCELLNCVASTTTSPRCRNLFFSPSWFLKDRPTLAQDYKPLQSTLSPYGPKTIMPPGNTFKDVRLFFFLFINKQQEIILEKLLRGDGRYSSTVLHELVAWIIFQPNLISRVQA